MIVLMARIGRQGCYRNACYRHRCYPHPSLKTAK